MGKFFHGWRRKTGCMTLVLACILTGGWIRSLRSIDLIEYPTGSATWQEWNLNDGIITFWMIDTKTAPHDVVPKKFGWRALGSWGIRFGCSNQASARWRTLYDPDDGDPEVLIGPHKYLQIPISAVVIPLTLLSAWLLLSKSRTKNGRDTDRKLTTWPPSSMARDERWALRRS